MDTEKTIEDTKHRIIDPNVCPQCGSRDTVLDSRDGGSDYYYCNACGRQEEKNPESVNPFYFICFDGRISSVNWKDGEETIYDTGYLVRDAAADLMYALSALVEHGVKVNKAFYVDGTPKAMREAMKGQKELLQQARTALARAAGQQ